MEIIHLASLCQDPNLPWFLAATVTAASVTDTEETESDHLPKALRRKATTDTYVKKKIQI